MIQCYTLDDPQCLDELRRNGFQLVLFILYIRDEEQMSNKVPRGNQGEKKSNSRSKFNPLLNNTSRYPVAEVIQIRSLDGTVYEGEVSERG